MLVDARELPADQHIDTDVCIVGAGAAGITMARELNGTGVRVCLMESGGFEREQKTQTLYEGPAQGTILEPDSPYLETSRLRFFGGTTNHWSGYCRPLDPIDFEGHDWIPHSGWPLEHQALEPYYRRAASVCEIEPFGYRPETRFAHEDFPLFFGPSRSQDQIGTVIYHFSPPTRFGKIYREELTASSNVTVYLHANAVELVPAEDGTEVNSVHFATLQGKRLHINARRFVLASGGIESPRLMLASNSKVPKGLGNEHDVVGRYFLEHPHAWTGLVGTWKSYQEIHNYHQYAYDLLEHRILGVLATTPQFRRRERTLGFSAQLSAPDETYKERYSSGFAGAVADSAFDLDFPGHAAAGSQHNRAFAYLWSRVEQAPNPDSRVTLGNERDALGMPKARLDWQLSELDIQSVRKSLLAVARAFGTQALGRVQLRVGDDPAWPDGARGGNHHMGTLRMGTDPRRSVVDSNCRVHGIGNLYVAGSAVFPTGGYANPTYTIVALAIRLSDHLRQQLDA